MVIVLIVALLLLGIYIGFEALLYYSYENNFINFDAFYHLKNSLWEIIWNYLKF